MPRYSSVRSIEGPTKRERRSTKNISTVSTRGGPKRALTYQGTPVSKTGIAPSKAPSRAQEVRESLKRVRKAYSSGPDLSSSGLDPEQQGVLSTVLRVGSRVGATPKEKLAAVETGLVESNLRNLKYGDRDSLGWRQERAGQYGAENATNVKGGARRFFEESKTDTSSSQHRGRGMTAGQLAQAIQGSAFPERYDERRGEAKALLRAADKPKVKPKKRDLKTLEKAGVSAKPKKAKAPTVKKKPGPWAGAQKAVLSKVPASVRAEGRGDKRTPEENASVGGSPSSDHLTTNQRAYAADLPADDAVARKIAKRVGLPSHTGTNEVVKNGYRYQMIWQDEGHYDHIHFGAEWVGKGVPPGTTLGGPSGGGGGFSSSDISTYAGATGMSTKAAQAVAKKNPELIQNKLKRIRAAYGDSTPTVSTSDLERKHGTPAI